MKYRFEITYQNKWIKKASEFLSGCDLGFDGFGMKDIITFESKKDLEISVIKEKLKESMEATECQLLHIEGGKIE